MANDAEAAAGAGSAAEPLPLASCAAAPLADGRGGCEPGPRPRVVRRALWPSSPPPLPPPSPGRSAAEHPAPAVDSVVDIAQAAGGDCQLSPSPSRRRAPKLSLARLRRPPPLEVPAVESPVSASSSLSGSSAEKRSPCLSCKLKRKTCHGSGLDASAACDVAEFFPADTDPARWKAVTAVYGDGHVRQRLEHAWKVEAASGATVSTTDYMDNMVVEAAMRVSSPTSGMSGVLRDLTNKAALMEQFNEQLRGLLDSITASAVLSAS